MEEGEGALVVASHLLIVSGAAQGVVGGGRGACQAGEEECVIALAGEEWSVVEWCVRAQEEEGEGWDVLLCVAQGRREERGGQRLVLTAHQEEAAARHGVWEGLGEDVVILPAGAV